MTTFMRSGSKLINPENISVDWASAKRTSKRGKHTMTLRRFLAIVLIILTMLCNSCSIKKIAMNRLGDALAQGGTAFSSDNDPEMIRTAAPFSLKLMESILAECPQHIGLLLALSSGFTQYAFAFVVQEAEETEENDLAKAMEGRARAMRLYLRARDYGLRALDVRYPGFVEILNNEPEKAVRNLGKKDVPYTYWTAVSWAGAISMAKDSAELIADLPKVEALIDRALVLDEAFDSGAIHSFLITYEMNRASGIGDPENNARRHFERAVVLSDGQQAGPFVTLAESVLLPKQDKAEFKNTLQMALAIDTDMRLEWRLANVVMQRKARWLLQRIDKLFVE
jgi:predicted anti-sigma-YlaC factor YlaD